MPNSNISVTNIKRKQQELTLTMKKSPDGFKAFAHDGEVSMGTVPEYQGPGDSATSGTADGPMSKDHEIDIDTDDGAGGGARGSAAKPSAPHMTGNSEHGSKQPTGHTPPKSQASSPSKHASNGYSFNKDAGSKMPKSDTQPAHSPKITWAKDPKESDRNTSGSSHGGGAGPANGKAGGEDPNKVREQIMNDKLLRGKDVHAGKMLENAAANQIDATADVAKHVLNSGPVQQSLAEGQKILENIGVMKKEKSSNELPHVKDDNDLPPNSKN